MSKLVCYCKVSIMAQCVANNVGEQQACYFSMESANGNRCMHLNASMNNHCWNTKAHDYFHNYGVVRLEDLKIETVYDEVEDLTLEESGRRNCRNCVLFACNKLVVLSTTAQSQGALLSEQDFWDMATNCNDYAEA